MPNEIKAPKVLKDTIKEVYNFMKVENLLLEFDRKTILRLIIEALSVEDITAMKNAKDEGERTKLYQDLMKKYHSDKNPDNKDDAAEDIAKLEKLKNDPQKYADIYIRAAQQGGKEADSGGQGQQSSEEQVEDIKKFLEKTKQKYGPLNEQMKQVIERYNKDPRAFFEDQEFIANLIKIAGNLNEQKEQDLGVELKDGDLKGNIERIIVGLEQIRKELLEALAKKAELIKLNPPAEKGEDQKQITEATHYNESTNFWKSIFIKFLKKNPKMKAGAAADELIRILDTKNAGEINKWIEAAGGTAQAEEWILSTIQPAMKYGKNSWAGIASNAREKKGVGMFILPNREKIEVTAEEVDNVYEITDAADKFVRIYSLLFKLIEKVAQIDTEDPNPNIKPNEPLVALDNIKPIESEPEKDEAEPVDDVTDDQPDFWIERQSFLSWYEDNAEPKQTTAESIKRLSEGSASAESMFQAIEDFEDGFITEPMLQIQSSIFASLYNFLLKLENRDFLKKFPQASTTAARNPDEIEQTRGQKLQEEENKEGVSFEEEDIQVFKKEHSVLLELAKRLKTEVLALDLNSVETLGGAKVLDDAKSIAKELQQSLGRVYDTVENELSALVDSGGTLKEAQEFDTERNVERSDKRKESREEKGKKVVDVYKAVTGYMTKLDQLIRKNESGAIDGNDLFMYAKESKDKLEEIKAFFPRFAPLGKMVDNPEKMFKQLKRFAKGLVRDIKDVVEQLKGIARTSPINEQAVKASTDKQTVQAFLNVLEKASTSVQDYFDAPSMIGKVKATRTPKVDNMKTAAAEGPAGDKAIKQGKAEEADREEIADDKDDVIRSVSDAMKVFSRSRAQLNKLFNNVVRMGKMNIQQSVDSQNFTFFKLLVLLKNQPEEVKEAVKADFSVQSGKHVQELGLTKEKVVVLNTLFSKHKGSDDPTITNLYYLLKKLIKNKTSISYLNQQFPKFLETSGETYNFSLPQAQLASLLVMKDDASDDTNTEEWQSQEFIRKEVKKAREENPDANEKEIIKQAAKEVINKAKDEDAIPDEKQEKTEFVKDVVEKVKDEVQSPTDDTEDQEVTEETEAEVEQKVKEKTEEENIDMEELKDDEQKKEEIAQQAAEEVIDNLPPEEKPETEEEKQELRKTLIDIAIQDIEDILRGDSENVSIEDAKKILNAKSFKKLEEFINDMNDYFNKNIKGRESEFANNKKLVKELIQRYESTMQRIDVLNEQFNKTMVKGILTGITANLNSMMDFIKRGEQVESSIKLLQQGFNQLKDNISLFKQAVKEQDEPAVQQAVEDLIDFEPDFQEEGRLPYPPREGDMLRAKGDFDIQNKKSGSKTEINKDKSYEVTTVDNSPNPKKARFWIKVDDKTVRLDLDEKTFNNTFAKGPPPFNDNDEDWPDDDSKNEQIQRKLEIIIEHYINNRKR